MTTKADVMVDARVRRGRHELAPDRPPVRPGAAFIAVVRRLDAALLAPGRSCVLAAVRIALAAVIALRLGLGPYGELAGQPAALFRPPPFLSWLPAMPSSEVLIALQVGGTVAAVAATLDWKPHRTLPLAWLTLLVLAGLRGSFGKVLHNDVLVLLASVPIVFAPADARLDNHSMSVRWGWPVRGALSVVALVYFACGMQKIRNSGLSWVTGDNMRWILSAGAADGRAPTDLVAQFLADQAWLTHVVAGCVLALELTAPLLLARPRARLVFVINAALLHLGVWLTLGLDYWGWALAVAAIALPSALVPLAAATQGAAQPRRDGFPKPASRARTMAWARSAT